MQTSYSIEELETIFNVFIAKADRAKIKESIGASEYKLIDLAKRKTADNLRKILEKIKRQPLEERPKISYK